MSSIVHIFDGWSQKILGKAQMRCSKTCPPHLTLLTDVKVDINLQFCNIAFKTEQSYPFPEL